MRFGREAAAALALDALLGEPPESLHPTVWMGRAISACEKRTPGLENPSARRMAGVALALCLPAGTFLAARSALGLAPRSLRRSLEAALISTALSMRGLARAAGAVEGELRAGDLAAARARVGEFVGRDTDGLSAEEVARAAVESVAENTSDGVVAPLLYGAFLGAPGALAYRAINTLDSMVGYREPPYTELGWAPARLDDAANLLPARITALLVAAVSGRFTGTIGTARRYGPLSRSPNAGWTEAAFAGALNVRLGGTNTYGGVVREGAVLGDGRAPGADDIPHAVRLMRRCCALLAALLVLPGGIRRG